MAVYLWLLVRNGIPWQDHRVSNYETIVLFDPESTDPAAERLLAMEENPENGHQIGSPAGEKRPWQFSLWTLFVFVTSCAVVLSIANTPVLAAFCCLYSFVWLPFLIVWIIEARQRKAARNGPVATATAGSKEQRTSESAAGTAEQ